MTWSKPQDITATTKRSQRATTITSGPGVGIQLTRGPHKGRLIHVGTDSTGRNRGTVWISKDGGATWPVKRELWPAGSPTACR